MSASIKIANSSARSTRQQFSDGFKSARSVIPSSPKREPLSQEIGAGYWTSRGLVDVGCVALNNVSERPVVGDSETLMSDSFRGRRGCDQRPKVSEYPDIQDYRVNKMAGASCHTCSSSYDFSRGRWSRQIAALLGMAGTRRQY